MNTSWFCQRARVLQAMSLLDSPLHNVQRKRIEPSADQYFLHWGDEIL